MVITPRLMAYSLTGLCINIYNILKTFYRLGLVAPVKGHVALQTSVRWC